MSRYASIRDALNDAGAAVAKAEAEMANADALLSVAQSVRYLARHGIEVHENTVRYWCKSGRVQIVRVGEKVRIPVNTLAKIANCPFCASR